MNMNINMKTKFACLLLVAGVVTNSAWAARMVIPAHEFISLNALPICYDFGCKNSDIVTVSINEWDGVLRWFSPAAETPAAEREQIKQAIGWMEVVIGHHTPTHKDLAFDLPPNASADLFPGQLDCIDEAVNTTSYLKLFETHGLLKHHVTIEAAYRRSWFDQHWAGQVRERQSGERFVVDSWFQPNGHLPVIQSGKDWENISRLTAVVDNSPDQEGTEVKRSRWHRFLRGE